MLAKIAASIGIKGFIAIGMALAFALAMWRISSLSGELETKRDQLAAEKAAHAITRASVDELQGKLAQFVGAGQAALVAQAGAVAAQAKENAQLQAVADQIHSETAQIKPNPGCKTPSSILNGKGL